MKRLPDRRRCRPQMKFTAGCKRNAALIEPSHPVGREPATPSQTTTRPFIFPMESQRAAARKTGGRRVGRFTEEPLLLYGKHLQQCSADTDLPENIYNPRLSPRGETTATGQVQQEKFF